MTDVDDAPKKAHAIQTIIAVIICCVTMVTTVFFTGRRTGYAESQIAVMCESVNALSSKVESHESIIDEMRREAAYQKGVVNTKLDSLSVDIGDIKTILSNWEPE